MVLASAPQCKLILFDINNLTFHYCFVTIAMQDLFMAIFYVMALILNCALLIQTIEVVC